MKPTSVLSVAGLSSVAAPVLAHGDHGSMMIAQLVGHVLSGEHLLLVLGAVAVSFLLIGRVAKKS
ncbi:MAG: hypothetical protein CMD66_09455 [Gammaproteobacteria bacterium]|nr:hypothetical protein [Gammaproteobacteria bacterium]|tara:strand:+ start:929 stop:1123 length:195 start_codon:yes stop_codon:yes gene_type:complete